MRGRSRWRSAAMILVVEVEQIILLQQLSVPAIARRCRTLRPRAPRLPRLLADLALVVPLVLAARLVALHAALRGAHHLGDVRRPAHRGELVHGLGGARDGGAVAERLPAVGHVDPHLQALAERLADLREIGGAIGVGPVALEEPENAHQAKSVAHGGGVEGWTEGGGTGRDGSAGVASEIGQSTSQPARISLEHRREQIAGCIYELRKIEDGFLADDFDGATDAIDRARKV